MDNFVESSALQMRTGQVHPRFCLCCANNIFIAVELGYEVTMVKDATASFSWDEMRASLEINLPSYASALLPAQEMVNRLGISYSAKV